MGQDPDEIRRQIEATRERIGETADAIGYKADVPSRVRENIADRVDGVKETILDRVGGIRDTIGGHVDTIAGATADATDNVRGATSKVIGNPLGLAIGAWSVGFLAGLLMPMSELEERGLSPIRDRIEQSVQDADLIERGKRVIHSATQAAADSARDEIDDVRSASEAQA
ncbi:MAG: DUF3618 domain-containing protein [Candidatus Eremiobacteraeota bacterium]|nr:DUF3618 domain-containing protein [Candidatus Eremiobacteraeota bacterium]